MGLVAKLKDKLHHGSSTPASDTEDAHAASTNKPTTFPERVAEKLAHPTSGFSTPLSTESSSTAEGGLAGARGESKHAVKMERKREEKEERRRDVERKEERERGRRGGEDSWAELVCYGLWMWGVILMRAKAGPESDLLTEDYGFLPLMQSSKEDRESFRPDCTHHCLIVSPLHRETRVYRSERYHRGHDRSGNHRSRAH